MDPLTFQALDKAVAGGGSKLTVKALTGSTGAAAKALVTRLCEAGHLTPDGANRYSVTPAGQAAWEEQRQAATGAGGNSHPRDRATLVAFLELVRKKDGKALRANELSGFPAELFDKALAGRLVEAGEKANSYRLLPPGEELLLAQLPLADQIDRLEDLCRRAVAQAWATQQRLRAELDDLGERGRPLSSAAAGLERRAREAAAAFESIVAELMAFTAVTLAAQDFRKAVEAALADTRRELTTHEARLGALERQLREEWERRQEDVRTLERRLTAARDGAARPT